MKTGYVMLAILTCLTIVFGTGYRKATADERLESRIISTHNEIIRLKDLKKTDCDLIDNFPKDLLGICW